MTTYSASTLERLASELEAADKEMTPGPWGVLPEQFDPWHVNAPSRDVCALPYDHRPDERAADAHSICNLRNSAPEVAAALRAAVARVAELTEQADAANSIVRDDYNEMKALRTRLAASEALVDRLADLVITALGAQYVGEKVRIREEVASIRAAKEAK